MVASTSNYLSRLKKLTSQERRKIPSIIVNLTFAVPLCFIFCIVILLQHVVYQVFLRDSSEIYNPDTISWQEYIASTVYTISKDLIWILLYIRLNYRLEHTVLEISIKRKFCVLTLIGFHGCLVLIPNIIQLISKDARTNEDSFVFYLVIFLILIYFVYDLGLSICLTYIFIKKLSKLSIIRKQDTAHAVITVSNDFDKDLGTKNNNKINIGGDTVSGVTGKEMETETETETEKGKETRSNVKVNNHELEMSDIKNLNNTNRKNDTKMKKIDDNLIVLVTKFVVLSLLISISSIIVLLVILMVIADSSLFWISYFVVSIDCALNVFCVFLYFQFCQNLYQTICQSINKCVKKIIVKDENF